jgi:hypothetical protein
MVGAGAGTETGKARLQSRHAGSTSPESGGTHNMIRKHVVDDSEEVTGMSLNLRLTCFLIRNANRVHSSNVFGRSIIVGLAKVIVRLLRWIRF